MCQDKVGWDEPFPEDLKLCWEAWLQDLNHLSSALTSKEVQLYEFHHFSDSSVSGYGMCSDLRAVSKSCYAVLLWGRQELHQQR